MAAAARIVDNMMAEVVQSAPRTAIAMVVEVKIEMRGQLGFMKQRGTRAGLWIAGEFSIHAILKLVNPAVRPVLSALKNTIVTELSTSSSSTLCNVNRFGEKGS